MGGSRLLDDIARTLAEPMPRRRAVRVIGASIATLAVPGLRPHSARAARSFQTTTCPTGSGRRQCWTAPDWVPGRPDAQPYCCPFPEQQWECGDKDNGYQCRNTCPENNPVLRRRQKATWSKDTYPDGRPKQFNCCLAPDEAKNGDCLPSCTTLAGPGAHRCGGTCCPRALRCVRETSTCKACPPDRPVVCGSECCDRVEEQCLDVWSERSSGVRRRQCVDKCARGKRRCIGGDGELGECCPSGFPCCGTSCGCDGRTECATVRIDRGDLRMCRPKCTPPARRCNFICCPPDRQRQDTLADGRRVCRCSR